MRHQSTNMCGLKVSCYTASLIVLNDYLASFPGSKLTEKIGMRELNETLLNSVPNNWSKRAYVLVFDCEYIIFLKYANMFERMKISEYIY